MRLIVIEDDHSFQATIPELMGIFGVPITQETAPIFITTVDDIPLLLNKLEPGEEYVVILDDKLGDNNSIDSLRALMDVKEVWEHTKKIYGFSSDGEGQKKIVESEFPELFDRGVFIPGSKMQAVDVIEAALNDGFRKDAGNDSTGELKSA